MNPEKPSGYLIWWRESDDWHTLVTLWMKPLAVVYDVDAFDVRVTLHDSSGLPAKQWTFGLLEDECLFLESAKLVLDLENAVADGVLLIEISPTGSIHSAVLAPQVLHAIVDWYSEDGALGTLHSDQTAVEGTNTIELTEISVLESGNESNDIVLINGPTAQSAGYANLVITNHHAQSIGVSVDTELPPFTVSRLTLAAIFPDVIRFSDNAPISVSGSLRLEGAWERPYVVTNSQTFGAYHGGNRYFWSGLPRLIFAYMGQGELNPMFVECSPQTETFVNLFNTHGELESDYWVDVNLKDETGRTIVRRSRWLQARRAGVTRGSIRALLPPGIADFRGHVALRFTQDSHETYPGRLQALLEYRTKTNVSRVMAWSDQWNWHVRRTHSTPVSWMTYYRAWIDENRLTYVAITNAGVDDDYQESVAVTLSLRDGKGGIQATVRTIPPQGTLYASATELFPRAAELLQSQPWGLLVAECSRDLAAVALTYDQRTGACAAEHFLYVRVRVGGDLFSPSGG